MEGEEMLLKKTISDILKCKTPYTKRGKKKRKGNWAKECCIGDHISSYVGRSKIVECHYRYRVQNYEGNGSKFHSVCLKRQKHPFVLVFKSANDMVFIEEPEYMCRRYEDQLNHIFMKFENGMELYMGKKQIMLCRGNQLLCKEEFYKWKVKSVLADNKIKLKIIQNCDLDKEHVVVYFDTEDGDCNLFYKRRPM